MAITLRRPKNELDRLHTEVDDLFRSFFGDLGLTRFERGTWPQIDIVDKGDYYQVTAETPGCKAEDIEISVQGDMLTISGEKKQTEEKKEEGLYLQERSYGMFRRDLRLPTEIDPQKIDAVCKDGVLSLKLPKSEKAKATKVKIKGE